jgi:hypothetical protein
MEMSDELIDSMRNLHGVLGKLLGEAASEEDSGLKARQRRSNIGEDTAETVENLLNGKLDNPLRVWRVKFKDKLKNETAMSFIASIDYKDISVNTLNVHFLQSKEYEYFFDVFEISVLYGGDWFMFPGKSYPTHLDTDAMVEWIDNFATLNGFV